MLWPYNLSHNTTSAGLVNENDGTSHKDSLAVWLSTARAWIAVGRVEEHYTITC